MCRPWKCGLECSIHEGGPCSKSAEPRMETELDGPGYLCCRTPRRPILHSDLAFPVEVKFIKVR